MAWNQQQRGSFCPGGFGPRDSNFYLQENLSNSEYLSPEAWASSVYEATDDVSNPGISEQSSPSWKEVGVEAVTPNAVKNHSIAGSEEPFCTDSDPVEYASYYTEPSGDFSHGDNVEALHQGMEYFSYPSTKRIPEGQDSVAYPDHRTVPSLPFTALVPIPNREEICKSSIIVRDQI